MVEELKRFNTASGKYCCNVKTATKFVGRQAVSIPQAVSTVATYELHIVKGGETLVSIPQAVSTVATSSEIREMIIKSYGFQYRKR